MLHAKLDPQSCFVGKPMQNGAKNVLGVQGPVGHLDRDIWTPKFGPNLGKIIFSKMIVQKIKIHFS